MPRRRTDENGATASGSSSGAATLNNQCHIALLGDLQHVVQAHQHS